MSPAAVVKTLGDAVVLSYERSFEELVVTIRLWDESTVRLIARGVGFLDDAGTWECDGVVRLESLDQAGGLGYAIVDTDAQPTLRFVAETLTMLDSTGQEELLST